MPTEIFLSQANQPARITQQQLMCYQLVRSTGKPFNPTYFQSTRGINPVEFAWIKEAVDAVCDGAINRARVPDLNAWFRQQHEIDALGHYLNRQAQPVRVLI